MSDDQTLADSSATTLRDGNISFYADATQTLPTMLMRIGLSGLWVNPAIPKDTCAEQMLEVLRPLLQHTIDTEVERLTHERDNAAKAERARCMAVIRRLHDLLPTGERKRSKPGLRDALLAIEMLDQFIEAQKTEGRDE